MFKYVINHYIYNIKPKSIFVYNVTAIQAMFCLFSSNQIRKWSRRSLAGSVLAY